VSEAHNRKVAGSNPAPLPYRPRKGRYRFFWGVFPPLTLARGSSEDPVEEAAPPLVQAASARAQADRIDGIVAKGISSPTCSSASTPPARGWCGVTPRVKRSPYGGCGAILCSAPGVRLFVLGETAGAQHIHSATRRVRCVHYSDARQVRPHQRPVRRCSVAAEAVRELVLDRSRPEEFTLTPDVAVSNIRLMASRRAPGRPPAPAKKLTALGKWCIAQKLSRIEVAAKLGIPRPSLDRLCRGARRPGLELATRIEKLTRGEVPVAYWTRVPAHSAG
jgi:hypothetical protein